MGMFIALLSYIGFVIVLSIIFKLLPKFKYIYTYICIGGGVSAMPFISFLSFFDPPQMDLFEIYMYMGMFIVGGSLYGAIYYMLFVRNKYKKRS